MNQTNLNLCASVSIQTFAGSGSERGRNLARGSRVGAMDHNPEALRDPMRAGPLYRILCRRDARWADISRSSRASR